MPNHPEPVPPASQLAVLPFLSAVDGYLAAAAGNVARRTTVHRIMNRENEGYLQQVCTYFSDKPFSQSLVGRMFAIDVGIMGAAALRLKILRTRSYPTAKALKADLIKDLRDTNDQRKLEDVPVSYLAIPFVGSTDNVVLTLYSECDALNFFADDQRLADLLAMCRGFCRLFDWLHKEQVFATVRNFPLEVQKFSRSAPTVFLRLQEAVDHPLPKFQNIGSFNYDTGSA